MKLSIKTASLVLASSTLVSALLGIFRDRLLNTYYLGTYPTGVDAYTAALNHLLADREHVQKIGDTTIVCWASGAKPQYPALSLAAIFGSAPPAGMDENAVRSAVRRLAEGLPCPELDLEPERPFYILGIAPNAARLSVRFFYRDTFGALMRNVNAHHTRMEIVRPANDPYETIPLWAMLRETVNPNSRDKAASPVLSGAAASAAAPSGRSTAAKPRSSRLITCEIQMLSARRRY